jgi:hypothetical protein
MAVPEDVDAFAGDRVEDRCAVDFGYLIDQRTDVVSGEAVRGSVAAAAFMLLRVAGSDSHA